MSATKDLRDKLIANYGIAGMKAIAFDYFPEAIRLIDWNGSSLDVAVRFVEEIRPTLSNQLHIVEAVVNGNPPENPRRSLRNAMKLAGGVETVRNIFVTQFTNLAGNINFLASAEDVYTEALNQAQLAGKFEELATAVTNSRGWQPRR